MFRTRLSCAWNWHLCLVFKVASKVRNVVSYFYQCDLITPLRIRVRREYITIAYLDPVCILKSCRVLTLYYEQQLDLLQSSNKSILTSLLYLIRCIITVNITCVERYKTFFRKYLLWQFIGYENYMNRFFIVICPDFKTAETFLSTSSHTHSSTCQLRKGLEGQMSVR